MFVFNCSLLLIKVCRSEPMPGTEQSLGAYRNSSMVPFVSCVSLVSKRKKDSILFLFVVYLTSLPAAHSAVHTVKLYDNWWIRNCKGCGRRERVQISGVIMLVTKSKSSESPQPQEPLDC